MSAKRSRQTFTKSFKEDAVRLSDREDMSSVQVAKDLGIPVKMLYRWRFELRERGEEAFRGNGRRTSQQAELERLRLENETLRMERDILKKAAAWFAKQQL